MENLKIRVANAAESKEAQELFFELGYGWHDTKCQTIMRYSQPVYYSSFYDGELACDIMDVNLHHEEITLPQLRDLVVLKRNDVNDATHECMGDKFLVQENRRYEWTYSGWATSGIAMSKLKPIQEKQVASHNIEQQALQSNPKLFLDPTQNYAEIEWDGSFMKQDHWVEVPEGAEVAVKPKSDHAVYFFKGKSYFSDILIPNKWVSLKCDYKGYMDDVDSDVVWQRTQDEPFLTPESVVQREVHSKNVVQKANEFSERLKKLEYQFETTGSSASGSIGLIKNSTESTNIHGTINPKPDFVEQGAIVSDGGSTDYYKKEIPALVLERWKKTGVIEAEDIIRLFLGNDFTQGNNFKAGVRLISAQQGKGKAGIDQMYDLKKQEWFVASAKKAFIEFD